MTMNLIKTSMIKVVNNCGKEKKQLPLPLYDEVRELNESLFNEEGTWETPEYIKHNMIHTFRYYQDAALRFFIIHKQQMSFVSGM